MDSADGEHHQILVSNKDAGTVIGRGGATISGMQTKSGSRIRVSNNNEYFPGTMDRVVMITGATTEIVVAGSQLVLNELYCNPDAAQPPGADQSVTVNLLIPNASAGLVIGKGGDNIRKMVDESGTSKIQLSSKDKQVPGIEERLISCIGSVPQVIKATELIIVKICEDPQVKFINLSTQYKPGGMAMGPQGGFNRGPGGPPGPPGPPGPGGPGGPPGYGGAPQYGGYDAYGGMQNMQGGYRPEPPYGAPPPFSPYPAAPMYADYGPYGGGAYPPPPNMYGPPPHQMHGGYDAGMGAYGAPPPPVGGGAGGPGIQVQVADHIVPAILGRGGAVIKEMMELSGAVIKVSQKGEYAPGTTNRIVTITGSQSAAAHAHQLVIAKIPAQ